MKASVSALAVGLVMGFVGVEVGFGGERQVDVEPYREASEEKWEEEMLEFATLDREEESAEGAVLFVGSSSIRLWDTIGEDMAPYGVIQRGFGGSKWSDVAVHFERLITPHRFPAVVFFVGNDIKGAPEEDKAPEEIAALFEYVLVNVRRHEPEAAVFFVPVTPTEKRWAAWPAIQEANAAIGAVCEADGNAWVVETAEIYLGEDGKPRSELFKEDRIHLNREGYRLWGEAIKKELNARLGGGE
ncbi:MAG: GDSL-type esterase/lipase family protein [Verrucomicrobiota bacterium]